MAEPAPLAAPLAPPLADPAPLTWDTMTLVARLTDGDTRVEFNVTCTSIPPALLGSVMTLHLGPRVIMAMRLPDHASSYELSFGPTQLALDTLGDQRDFDVYLTRQGDAAMARIPMPRCEGPFFEALTLPTQAAFFEKAQLHHSRYTSKALLALAARGAYGRFPDFQPRAAALTILSHRYLEREFKSFTDADFATIAWITAEAHQVVEEGLGIVAAREPRWDMVRWTVSLATVGGLLALCRDDLAEARYFFASAVAQMGHVARAPVTALNLTNACLINGLLCAIAGDMAEARTSLESALTGYPQVVAAQDMLANIWVVGDLINVAHAARQCFAALGRLQMLREKKVPMLNDTDTVVLAQLQSPIGRIVKAGLAPRFAAGVAAIAAQPIQKPTG